MVRYRFTDYTRKEGGEVEIPHDSGDTIVGVREFGESVYVYSSNGWAYEITFSGDKPELTGDKFRHEKPPTKTVRCGPSAHPTGPSRYTNGVVSKKRDTNEQEHGKNTLR